MIFTVWHIVGACIIVAIVVAVIATLRTRHKDIKKVAYMMDALEDGEERVVALPGGGIKSASDLLEKQFVCKFVS